MAKPSVSLVKEWDIIEQNDVIQIAAGTAVFDYDYYRVTPIKGRAKYFYGEMAYQDAYRIASDLEWELTKDRW